MDPHRPGNPAPQALLAAGIALAGMTIAGCALPAAPTGSSPTATTSPVTAGSPAPSTSDTKGEATSTAPARPAPRPTEQIDRCHTSMLAASFENPDAGAGQRDVTLVLRNISAQPCNVFGYPGMQLQEADGRPVPTTVERNPDPTPKLITLAPGGSAVSTLRWTAINSPNEPGNPCEPTANLAEVTPPDERDPLTVDWTMGMVCGEGAMTATSFHQ